MARFRMSAVLGAVAVLSACFEGSKKVGTDTSAAAAPAGTSSGIDTPTVAVPGPAVSGSGTTTPSTTGTTTPHLPNDSGQITGGTGKTAAMSTIVHHVPNDSGQIDNKKLTARK